jgi:hypothetical protein
MSQEAEATSAGEREQTLDETLASVREALRELRYGTITVVVHDGAVVQIDRTEKLRVPRAPAARRAR